MSPDRLPAIPRPESTPLQVPTEAKRVRLLRSPLQNALQRSISSNEHIQKAGRRLSRGGRSRGLSHRSGGRCDQCAGAERSFLCLHKPFSSSPLDPQSH